MVEECLRKNNGFPIGYSGGSRMISEVYSEGIELKSSKESCDEKYTKHEVIIPEHVSKDITNKLIELAQAS